jgi:hypothetical protein
MRKKRPVDPTGKLPLLPSEEEYEDGMLKSDMRESVYTQSKRLENFLTPDQLLKWNLVRAELHCSQALDLVYGKQVLGQAPRGFWWRRRLLNAQSHLMTLVVRELSKTSKR